MNLRSFPALVLLAATTPLMGGCIVRTAADVVTAPVRVAGKAVDLATTSQSEADEKRGREIRKREERLGALDRAYRRHLRECADGDDRACDRARAEYREMQDIMPTIPAEPDY